MLNLKHIHFFVYCGLFTDINPAPFRSIVPSVSVWSTFCAWFICPHSLSTSQGSSLLAFTSACLKSDSAGMHCTTGDWGTKEMKSGNSWGNGETLSHYDKQEKKKAATFSKCHFGNFQLTSDHNSLSATLGCTDALFSAQLKTMLWCKSLWTLNFFFIYKNKKKST